MIIKFICLRFFTVGSIIAITIKSFIDAKKDPHFRPIVLFKKTDETIQIFNESKIQTPKEGFEEIELQSMGSFDQSACEVTNQDEEMVVVHEENSTAVQQNQEPEESHETFVTGVYSHFLSKGYLHKNAATYSDGFTSITIELPKKAKTKTPKLKSEMPAPFEVECEANPSGFKITKCKKVQ